MSAIPHRPDNAFLSLSKYHGHLKDSVVLRAVDRCRVGDMHALANCSAVPGATRTPCGRRKIREFGKSCFFRVSISQNWPPSRLSTKRSPVVAPSISATRRCIDSSAEGIAKRLASLPDQTDNRQLRDTERNSPS